MFVLILSIFSSINQAQNTIYYVGPNNKTVVPTGSLYYPYYSLNNLLGSLINSSNQNIVTLYLQDSTFEYNLTTDVYWLNKNITIQ